MAAQALLPLVFPVHPRTAQRLAAAGLDAPAGGGRGAADRADLLCPFMSLVTQAAAVITDSGGMQEETTYLGIPCLTLRENTERPITISEGTSRLVRAGNLVAELVAALAEPKANRRRPDRWDGRTAARCLADLRRRTVGAESAAA